MDVPTIFEDEVLVKFKILLAQYTLGTVKLAVGFGGSTGVIEV
jgi:hypothetical protein